MPSFLNNRFFCGLLKETAAADPRAVSILNAKRTQDILTDMQIPSVTEKSSAGIKAAALSSFITAIADFLREYPAPPSYRQGLWEVCCGWAGRMSKALDVPLPTDYEDSVPRPTIRDTSIELVKALHDENGLTKQELGDLLRVSTKTIQTDLRALCPRLQEGGKPVPPLRIGGQEMLVRIECDIDSRSGERRYHTENRMHPLVLQLNTMQVGELLRALNALDKEEDNIVCREIAADVWSQLSRPGKDRLTEIYGGYYEDFGEFAEYLEDECENRLVRFQTEYEMIQRLTEPEQLFASWKGGGLYTIRLRRGGKETVLKRVHVVPDEPSVHDTWVAKPADGGEPIRFRADEVNKVFRISEL